MSERSWDSDPVPDKTVYYLHRFLAVRAFGFRDVQHRDIKCHYHGLNASFGGLGRSSISLDSERIRDYVR